MSSEVVLEVSAVSKEYDIFKNQKQKFHKLFCDLVGRKTSNTISKHFALNDVSFTANRGEVIGVLGKNGAGKSTLLQIICGTVTPTSGVIKVRGRLAALLELGAGFNPDFTGKENIFINAAILGLSREEIEEKYQSILEFADIGSFIEQPVKNYSSGMFMRLAFSVAISVQPDLLIVDEALAVGDAKFQSKCFRKISELKERGTTILLVSHSTEQITRHCSKAIILNDGEMLAFGDAKMIANQYLELLFGKQKTINNKECNKAINVDKKLENCQYYNEYEHKWGGGQAELFDFNIVNGDAINPLVLDATNKYEISFSVKFHENISNVIVGITLKTQDGITVFGRNTKSELINSAFEYVKFGSVYNVTFYLEPRLCTGNYLLSIGVVREEDGDIIPLERRYDVILFRVENECPSYGIVDLFDKVEISDDYL
ncbi:ABC transporter ATP-binding protein [Vibrio cholerae]|uniref:ABC transporter ATP-binding protein n=1 Tax=Vibrio cholerae TaxID=666 RepID=UPI001583543A|nr:ABC transporter ATP-binding protein [Vibrio cholerae]QKU83273.1 ABC transporter ATP-binding protein [Vibrio cholerae]